MNRSTVAGVILLSVAFAAPNAAARPVNLIRTEFVSPVPGNPVASGTRLLRALADIAGASASDPWLLKVEPGVYDLGVQSLVMRPFIDVEGSGEGITVVRSAVNSIGTIQGADASELRALTVINIGATRAVALRNASPAFTASHVTCIARDSANATALSNLAVGGAFRDIVARAEANGVSAAVDTRGGLLLRARAFASATTFAYGVFSAASSGEITDVTAEAEGPSYATAFRNEGGGPLLRSVRAIGRGANISEGIVNGAASAARIQGAVIDVSGGASFASGIRNEFSSALLTDVTIKVEGASDAFGVTSSLGGAPSLRNVTVKVTGTGHVVGVRSFGTQVTVEASTVSATGFSLENEFGGTGTSISVGASRLEGAVAAADGTLRCASSYDQAFVALGAGCTP